MPVGAFMAQLPKLPRSRWRRLTSAGGGGGGGGAAGSGGFFRVEQGSHRGFGGLDDGLLFLELEHRGEERAVQDCADAVDVAGDELVAAGRQGAGDLDAVADVVPGAGLGGGEHGIHEPGGDHDAEPGVAVPLEADGFHREAVVVDGQVRHAGLGDVPVGGGQRFGGAVVRHRSAGLPLSARKRCFSPSQVGQRQSPGSAAKGVPAGICAT